MARMYRPSPYEFCPDDSEPEPIEWVIGSKRTNDPKLAYIEARLTEANVPHRRNGHSWHGPILEVPKHMKAHLDAILLEPFDEAEEGEPTDAEGCVRLDDVADDDEVFDEYTPHDYLP